MSNYLYDFEDGDEYSCHGQYSTSQSSPAFYKYAIPQAGTAQYFDAPTQLIGSKHGPEAATFKDVSADPQRERKYQLQLGRLLIRRGVAFDTNAIYDRFNAKTGRTIGGAGGQGKLSQLGRANYTHATRDHMRTWSKSLIWVLSEDNRVYSHVCKIDRFHHTSFTGSDVRAAGMWIVEFGKIKKISGHSGHYRPGIEHFLKMLQVLDDRAALHADTEALVWENSSNSWQYVTAKQVLAGNGVGYAAHP